MKKVAKPTVSIHMCIFKMTSLWYLCMLCSSFGHLNLDSSIEKMCLRE